MTNTTDDWSAALQNNFGLRSGLLYLVEVAFVSFIGPTVLLVITIRHAMKNYLLYGGWGPEGSSLQPVSLLFLIAIFMDSIQAMAGILTVRWVYDGKVTEGSYCTTQAVLSQIGNDGVSWFTIAIAVMTFLQTMFPGKFTQSQARQLTVAMITFIFLFIFLIITIPATTIPHYYGDTGPWCWIANRSPESSRLKIGSEYAYFWLAATVSFVLNGIIVVNWLKEATAKRDRRLLRDAISMGWYPIAYIVEIFPVSLVRFLEWRPKSPGPQHGFIIAADMLFASSGAVNVLLWFLTGRRFGFSIRRRTRRKKIVIGSLTRWGHCLLLQGGCNLLRRRLPVGSRTLPCRTSLMRHWCRVRLPFLNLMCGGRLRKEGWSLEGCWNLVRDHSRNFRRDCTWGRSCIRLGLGMQGGLVMLGFFITEED
ncbi:hypothetical protein BS47DRAFT_1383426 [Hydnum rufescens UP504]|uniref:Glucose receptor Git3 N-terminal domain-containing protein n=1 Tax=Hydnum rufescens UP504 TaxID=1448309 RepID=A0A9P6ATH0_9AGAM|nr:hypothetical protein BS47DRAFT_1383426 [Hydnum rufescens UP504]